MGGIPLAPFPMSNLVKVHQTGNPFVSLVPGVSLLVGFPDLERTKHISSSAEFLLNPTREYDKIIISAHGWRFFFLG